MNKIELLDNGNVKITIPLIQRTCAGRRRILLPEQPDTASESLKITLARAFRWQEMIDSGAYENAEALAHDAGIDPAQVRRTCRMTLLAPSIIHAVLAGNPVPGLSGDLRIALPDDWEEQCRVFG